MSEGTAIHPTPAEQLAARNEIDTLKRELAALPESLPQGHPERQKRIDRINNKLAPIAYAPEPAPTAQDWRTAQRFRADDAELRKELETYPEGHPRRQHILDAIVANSAAFHRDDAVPGTFTAGDLRKLAGEEMTDGEFARFAMGARALGVGAGDQAEWLRVTKLTAGREPTDSELAEAEGLLVKHADELDRALAPLPPADRSRLLNSFEHPQRLRVFLDAIRRAAQK